MGHHRGQYRRPFDQAKPGTLEHNGRTIKFPSQIEMERGAELMLLERTGDLNDLRFHPHYELKFNDYHIGFYTPDSSYQKPEGWYVEDVKSKGKGGFTREAKFKIKVFNACYHTYLARGEVTIIYK